MEKKFEHRVAKPIKNWLNVRRNVDGAAGKHNGVKFQFTIERKLVIWTVRFVQETELIL